MKKFRDSNTHDWATKQYNEMMEKADLIGRLNNEISELDSLRLKQLLDFAKTLNRAKKMEMVAKLESSNLTDYGKKYLENLKREIES